jgi:predicted O-methyltransferase YrrM
MRSLVRIGRRQVKRLISLSSRQALGLLLMAVVCVGVAVAALAGQPAVALALLAVLLAATLAGVVHLSRRIGGLHRTEQASIRDLRMVVDQLQRRVVGAVEKERLAAGDRHRELLETIAQAERLTPQHAERLLRDQNREVGSLLHLFQQMTPRAPMPVTDSATPTDVLNLMHLVRSRAPRLAVVLGAGPATVWLGYAVEKGGRLVVVEHDAERAAQIRSQLLAHDLTTVEVLHAPLTDLSVESRTMPWYDVDALDGLQDIDLLLVDGPGPDPVAPAMHVLGRRLAAGAEVVTVPRLQTVPRQSREMTPVS